MEVGDAHVFPGFVTQVLTKLFFQSLTDYFFHMLQRKEAKIHLKES